MNETRFTPNISNKNYFVPSIQILSLIASLSTLFIFLHITFSTIYPSSNNNNNLALCYCDSRRSSINRPRIREREEGLRSRSGCIQVRAGRPWRSRPYLPKGFISCCWTSELLLLHPRFIGNNFLLSHFRPFKVYLGVLLSNFE